MPETTTREALESRMVVQIHERVPAPTFVGTRRADGHVGNAKILRGGSENG